MTELPRDDSRVQPHDDRTRDITLPPLPDRPPAALPREWAGLPPSAPSGGAPEAPDLSEPPPATPGAGPAAGAADEPVVRAEAGAAGRPRPSWLRGIEDGPTDQLVKPQQQPRDRTLAFNRPEMAQRPASSVQVSRKPRRWPWLLLVLLPLVVIAGAAITLGVVLGGG